MKHYKLETLKQLVEYSPWLYDAAQYELSEDEKAQAINLAMALNMGAIPLRQLLAFIRRDPLGWKPIIVFWMRCNDRTQGLVEKLCLEQMYLKRSA